MQMAAAAFGSLPPHSVCHCSTPLRSSPPAHLLLPRLPSIAPWYLDQSIVLYLLPSSPFHELKRVLSSALHESLTDIQFVPRPQKAIAGLISAFPASTFWLLHRRLSSQVKGTMRATALPRGCGLLPLHILSTSLRLWESWS